MVCGSSCRHIKIRVQSNNFLINTKKEDEDELQYQKVS